MIRPLLLFLALVLGLQLAGCSDRPPALVAEVDDAEFKRARALNERGDSGKALAAFLSVIAARGEENSPESLLEAGLLYRKTQGDPIEAIHLLKKYVQLKPNAPRADYVRAQIDASVLDFFKVYVAQSSQPFDRTALENEIVQLRKDNDELRAIISSGRPSPNVPASGLLGGQQRAGGAGEVDAIVLPVTGARPAAQTPATIPVASGAQPVGLQAAAGVQAGKQAAAPTQAAASSARGERTITVLKGEGLWGIATRAFGRKATAADVKALEDANREAVAAGLHPGTVLRVPKLP